MNIRISLWKKQSGNALSHKQGLTNEEVEFLRTLKPGDRLVLWSEAKDREVQPDFKLTKFNSRTDA